MVVCEWVFFVVCVFCLGVLFFVVILLVFLLRLSWVVLLCGVWGGKNMETEGERRLHL